MNPLDFSHLLDEPATDALALVHNKQQSYRYQMAKIQNLSYSYQGILHTCPKKFELNKLSVAAATSKETSLETNIHFMFGHAVGTGIQEGLITDDKEAAQWAAICAWNGYLLTEDKQKSIWHALNAIEVFFSIKEQLFRGWQVAYFNGKPACELEFLVQFPNGYNYYGHIDLVMYHPVKKIYRVLELKTTGAKWLHPAMYENSNQALGYSIVLDKLVAGVGNPAYEVLYLVYQTGAMEYTAMPFLKSKATRAEWLQDIILDFQNIQTYRELKFFPKRGEGCMSFGKACQFFGTCGMPQSAISRKSIEEVGQDFETTTPDFEFTLEELVQTQLQI